MSVYGWMNGASIKLDTMNTTLPIVRPFYCVISPVGRTDSVVAYVVLVRFYSNLISGSPSTERLFLAVTSIALVNVNVMLTSLCSFG